jgi:DNA repair exonuclease SbcCD nuclease subunit
VIVAHLSDLHLGHRAYDRADGGWNVRERDVASAFQLAIQELITLRPDLVLVAGDIFDRPDPPPGALVVLSRGLETLRGALPDTRVLMVAGARDTPSHHSDPGALAAVDAFANVEAATVTSRPVHLKELDTHVVMVPHRAVVRQPLPSLEPDPGSRFNILLAHASVAQDDEVGVMVVADQWDYVALGFEHQNREVAPGVFYSGSLERIGPRPWKEAGQEKGFLTYDMEKGESTFHPIPGRPVVALAPIKATAGDAALTVERIREVMEEVPGGIKDKIVQIRIEGISAADLESVDSELLSTLRKEALHLALSVAPTPVDEDVGPEPAPLQELDLPSLLRDTLREHGDGADRLLEIAEAYVGELGEPEEGS